MNTISRLALGSAGTFGMDADGYTRAPGPFPYPTMTHSQHSKSAADITILGLAITEWRPTARDLEFRTSLIGIRDAGRVVSIITSLDV